MSAETTREFEALEAQAQTLMSVFTKAGYEAVAPAIIQPADVFLDVIGESLRARTYVFTDPDGAELCLRPDITVPTCRLHLARHVDPATPARYCYRGAAFRFQPQGVDASHPREFRQAGIERFGDAEREAAEADVIAIVIKAIEKLGLKDWTLRLGDLGLFSSILDVAGISPRWKKRLDDAFLKPQSFREALKAFASGASTTRLSVPAALLASLDSANRVFYVGTFSKCLGAGLRLGYVVVPPELMPAARRYKALTNNGQPWLEQAVLADFMNTGGYARHLRKIRQHYLGKRDALLQALGRAFGDGTTIGAEAGMHMVWRTPDHLPAAPEILTRALNCGVGVYDLSPRSAVIAPTRPDVERYLIFGYSSLSEKQIATGIERLADAVQNKTQAEDAHEASVCRA